ncbi:hypothetical protein [Granulicella sibirica]|uniref:Uncharacterized protein n=1 Tax=Granulicella sibirica TaxID=2479048 RepID=A0A4Q0T9X7_9BACT|nr:hypothetical protein [Granulicella sibirica]RXH58918.1 hypothetical protein GRAN_2228 [Granulicella sibirica]
MAQTSASTQTSSHHARLINRMRMRRVTLILALCACAFPILRAQQSPEAQSLVQRAVEVEIAADRDDHSLWHYRMSEKQDNDSVYDVVDTTQGDLKRKIQLSGRPLTADEQRAETARIQDYITDAHAQAKKKRDSVHDDESAEKLLNLLPKAFLWKVVNENAESIDLHFDPDPNFKAPDYESRVLSAMMGDLIVDKKQHRIATIRGTLAHEVDFGYGLFGRLKQGGTFNVERRELSPGVWQIIETHVHIDGRALLFKTIGEETDEVKTNFQPIPPGTTLAEAAKILSAK